MVRMGCIRSRPENRCEPAAGGPAQRLDEARDLLVPRRLDALPASSGKIEPGDVDGNPAAVGAYLRPLEPVARPARKARTRAEGDHRPACRGAGERLGRSAGEVGESAREGTAHHRPVGPADIAVIGRHAFQLHRICDRAVRPRVRCRGRREADTGDGQSCLARRCCNRRSAGCRTGSGWRGWLRRRGSRRGGLRPALRQWRA